MSISPVGYSGSSGSAQSAPSTLELLNSARRALNHDNPTQAEALVRQLPATIAHRLFYLAWEASGSPMGAGDRFGEEAFFGQNLLPLDVDVKRALLEQVIQEQSSSCSSGSSSPSPAGSGSSPGFSLPGQISGLLRNLGNMLTGRRPTHAAAKSPVTSAALSSRIQFALQIVRSTHLGSSLVDIISEYAIECLGEDEWLQYFHGQTQKSSGLLKSALDALNRNDENLANAFVQQLPPEVANDIYHAAWEAGGRPMNMGSRFGEEAFLGHNQHPLDFDSKRSILRRMVYATQGQSRRVDTVSLPCATASLDSWLKSEAGRPAKDLSVLPLRTSSLGQIRDATGLSMPLATLIHIYAIDCFGTEEWRRYFQEDVYLSEPELPQEFYDFWYGPDPFDWTQMVCDTHLPPVLRPQVVVHPKLNGGRPRNYNLENLGEMVRRRSTSWLSSPGLSRDLRTEPSSSAAWLVMRKGVIGRNHKCPLLHKFTDFLNARTQAGYLRVRSALDISTIVFARHAATATGERHLGDATGAEGRPTMTYTSDKQTLQYGDMYLVLLGNFSSGARLNVGVGDRQLSANSYDSIAPCAENGIVFLREF